MTRISKGPSNTLRITERNKTLALFNVSEHSLQEESYSISKTSVDCLILHKTQGEKKWVAPILDHILQDQSLDHSLVLDQDQDHTQGRRDTGELLCFYLFKL